jgi:hypothetical protein
MSPVRTCTCKRVNHGFVPRKKRRAQLQPDELAELRGTAALDKLEGRVQHPADAPTRVEELFGALVVPLVEGDKGLAKVGGR